MSKFVGEDAGELGGGHAGDEGESDDELDFLGEEAFETGAETGGGVGFTGGDDAARHGGVHDRAEFFEEVEEVGFGVGVELGEVGVVFDAWREEGLDEEQEHEQGDGEGDEDKQGAEEAGHAVGDAGAVVEPSEGGVADGGEVDQREREQADDGGEKSDAVAEGQVGFGERGEGGAVDGGLELRELGGAVVGRCGGRVGLGLLR